ncbi:MAG: DEAD/DEAH box helicase family protein [Phycisphaerae bacterium]|nr:DEAD/DEAH box helicase family protein [Phycisphaerae bacterium]
MRIVRPSAIDPVDHVEDFRISPRRTEALYILASGERIVVTARPSCPTPDDVDGVLLLRDGEAPQWLAHRLAAESDERNANRTLAEVRRSIAEAWQGAFQYRSEQIDARGNTVRKGLRPPQLGALFAIGAHWSLYNRPATIVMPTGTGKTETMLATLVALTSGPTLIVVPSRALRGQTAVKIVTLGLLPELDLLPVGCPRPVVGTIERRPRSTEELAFFNECNVIVGTVQSLAQGTATALCPEIAQMIDTLMVDEAHHIAAETWRVFREQFSDRRILQFTATPFRRDGKLVDGDVIYTYPLRRAQTDGYFKPLTFEPVCELDPEDSDRAIAESAVARLREDLDRGLDHKVMARCETQDRAREVHGIYEEIAAEFAPTLVHSGIPDTEAIIQRVRSGESRVVVCVDMLGEGFDLPELKIAAIHDTHKSIAVLLQFAGRFTRVSGNAIGDATAIANIANQDVSASLERLYSEDADWNHLLSEFSSQAVREHAELVQFLRESIRLDDTNDAERLSISSALLRPKFSAAVYRCASFHPRRFHTAVPQSKQVAAVWLNESTQTLFFVTRAEPAVPWSRSKELIDRQWDLFVLHHDPTPGLLYLHSSDKTSLHENLAKAVGGPNASLVYGDQVFRALGEIARLRFLNVGVRKHGRRNISYAMYTGADVASALSASQRAGSIKSNLTGDGFRDGERISIGCSYKGRIWSKDQGPIKRFVSWCRVQGRRLLDDSIDTNSIIENVMIPDEAMSFPDKQVLSLEWPHEILSHSEDRVVILQGDNEFPLSVVELNHADVDRLNSVLRFTISFDQYRSTFGLTVGGDVGFSIDRISGPELRIRIGRMEHPIEDYFTNYPPLVLFVDLAELDGNLLYEMAGDREFTIPAERFEVWDWAGTNIQQESYWKDGAARPDSIQAKAAEHYRAGCFSVVFDDDSSGEAADLICMTEDDEHIRLALVHCKFTTSDEPGRRLKDIIEVCSQAVRSGRWIGQFKRLCRHVVDRDRRLRHAGRPTRFMAGDPRTLNSVLRASRFKQVRAEIVIVQPGLSQQSCTPSQATVLAAAHSFLMETVATPLDIVCSA